MCLCKFPYLIISNNEKHSNDTNVYNRTVESAMFRMFSSYLNVRSGIAMISFQLYGYI